MAEGGSKRINVVVKTPKDKKTVEVDEDSGIREVSAVRVTHSGGVVTLGDPKPLRCPCPFPFPSIPLRPAHHHGQLMPVIAGTVHFA